MFWKPRKIGQRGQSAVETAIVMPMNVFILLAIIQQGLIAQARVMTKYAAYRAVRVGAMNNARTDMMTNAALATLLPVLAMPTLAGPAVFPNMADPTSAAEEAGKAVLLQSVLGQTFLAPVKVVICGPLSSDIGSISESSLGGTGDSEVDFDDPRASTEWGGDPSQAAGFKTFMQTKLRIQVQFMYPMIIPFANYIIELAYLGQALPSVMNMEVETDFLGTPGTPSLAHTPSSLTTAQTLLLLGVSTRTHQYYAPINVSYAMRMQSNFYPSQSAGALPSDNLCIHYTPSS